MSFAVISREYPALAGACQAIHQLLTERAGVPTTLDDLVLHTGERERDVEMAIRFAAKAGTVTMQSYVRCPTCDCLVLADELWCSECQSRVPSSEVVPAYALPTDELCVEAVAEADLAVILNALNRLQVLPQGAGPPRPTFATSGVAGKSRLYGLLIRHPDGRTKCVVAKRDLPDRAQLEWEALAQIEATHVPSAFVRQLHGNVCEDEVILYDLAGAEVGACAPEQLASFAIQQLLTNPPNVLAAVDQLVATVGTLCSSGNSNLKASGPGGESLWRDAFPETEAAVSQLRQEPSQTLRPADVDALARMLSRCQSELDSQIPVSLWGPVHGDLHAANVLVILDATRRCQGVRLVDHARFSTESLVAQDLAWFECFYWQEVMPQLAGGRGLTDEQVLEVAHAALAYLRGERSDYVCSDSDLAAACVAFAGSWRRASWELLQRGRPRYAPTDYLTAQLLLLARCLTFPTHLTSELRQRLAILGMQQAAAALDGIVAGMCAGDASPFRFA